MNVFMNNRNHRKIIVIDGKTALTGGINIGDEYINEIERFGYWVDSAIIIKGKAVISFLAMFCSMWEFTAKKPLIMRDYLAEHNIINDGFYIPYCDNPLNSTNPAQGIYMQIISTAQKYVYITTPYLILDNEMLSVLSLAAKSGVDIRIITPHVPDKRYVHPVTQYYYSELLDAGVKIYEYTPGFIHSKLFVSDDSVATVGTVNMDYRSFNFHFECGVWCSGAKTIKDVKANFIEISEKSQEIDKNEWDKRSLFLRFRQSILHLFAPLM
jgi:cardiolipin synthase